MTRPYSNDLRERAMARVAAGETIRVVAAALRILVRFKMVGTPARDRQRVCGADWRPQAARFVGRSRRLAAGPGVVRFFYAAGTGGGACRARREGRL